MGAAISPDSAFVLVASSNNVDRRLPAHRSLISMLSGRDGSVVTEFPFDGTEGVALSLDGSLLAAGYRVPLEGRRTGTQPTVAIIEVTSGKQIATIIQDQFRENGKEYLYAGFNPNGILFTLDGKYLITSGLNTKVWRVG
jgi:hypothetical protein